MFMSYVGKTLASWHDLDRRQLIQQAEKSLQAIHKLNVLQGDPIPDNMVEEKGRVMLMDFEQATLQPHDYHLGIFHQIESTTRPAPGRKAQTSILTVLSAKGYA
ncbi:hypothetical protein BDV12DRAFT_178895 [Aspergillus spectabilis]